MTMDIHMRSRICHIVPATLICIFVQLFTLTVNGANLQIKPNNLPCAQVGVAFLVMLSVNNGAAPYSYAMAPGTSLPTGLTMSSTGTISGTPTAAGPYNFTVQVTDAKSNTGSRAYQGTVTPQLVISTASLPNGSVGAAYNSTLTATGGTGPYTWSAGAWVGGGALPTGLSLTSAGVLSGTPTAAGSFSFILQVTDSGGATATHTYTVSISSQLSITTSTLPNGTVGSGYSATLAATGGTAPYTWSIASGGLPAGLSLGTTGTISGTPTTAANYTFSVTATDSAGLKTMCSYSMAIVAPVSVSVSPTSASVPVAQTQQFSATVSGTSNTGVSWTVNGVAGGDSTMGTVSTSGLYTAPKTVPSSTVMVAAVSAADTAKSGKAPVTVVPAVSVSISPITASIQVGQNQQFSATVSGTSNTGVTWNVNGVAGGNSTVGTVSTSGLYTAPSTAPTSPVTVAAVSVADATKSAQAAVTVISGLAITTTALPNGNQGVAYSATLSATGGTAPYSWSILSGLLPQGVSLTTTTGAISGTPTTSGTYNVAVQVTDAAGHQSSKSFSLVIAAALTITTTALPGGTVGVAYSATLAATGGCTTSSYVWSVSGQLPPGLTFSTSGSLSGMPTTAGKYSFGIQVMDCSGAVVQQSCTVTVSNPVSTGSTLTITTADLPNGTVGAAYAATMLATGGTPPYTWTLSTGALPTGLTLNSSTGAISGTPNVVGWSNLFGIQTQDATGATTSLSYSFIVNPATDQYGGVLAQTCTATGVFHTQKLNNRWWFCTPAGHVYWNLSVGAVAGQDGSGTDSSTGLSFNLATTNAAKYGDITYNWAVAQNRRLQLWGFNGIGQLSSTYVKPMSTGFSGGDGTQPVKLPMTDTLMVSNYAGVNLWGYGTRPLKNLAQGYSDHSRVWVGRKAIMDYIDPAFQTYVSGLLANDGAVQSYKASPYLLGLFLDDTDWAWGFGAGPDFPTQPALSHNNSAPAYEVIVTSPVQRFQPNPAYADFGVMYSDGRVFSKVAMSSPPATCNIITPCSLRDYLYKKYNGSIAALNNAWGSSYTTFDSSGATYAGAQIGTGDGSTTTFNFTLPNTPVSPYSIAVYVNGVQVGGDCPYYNSACNSLPNVGSFMSPQGTWSGGQIYAQTYIIDSNGNLEQAQNTGNNGSLQPMWNTTYGGATIAGNVTWKNLGPSIKSGSTAPWTQDTQLSAANCGTCGLPQASYWLQTTWHGTLSAPSRQIGTTYASGAPQVTITTQNNASDAPPGVTSIDIYVSCRVLSGPASHGCVAASDPSPAPTLQASGIPYPAGSWTEPTSGLVAGAALPPPPSAITYASGNGSLSFNVPPATGAAITMDYIARGWPYGTGLMDEDGRNTSWLGTNDVCLTPHILVCGPGLSFGAPNASPAAGADLEAWNAQFAASYFSQSKAAMTAQLPGVLYFGTDTLGTWGAPPPIGVLQGAAPYIDAMFTAVYPGQTYSDSIYQFITQYLGDKPMMNFLTEQATPDSFLWSYGAQSGQVVAAPTQEQRGQHWSATINAMLNALSYNGTYQWIGANWWGLYDFWNEKTNWGLVSLYDNPYDGKSSCQQKRLDPWGNITGGESPANGAACFGSSNDYVKQGNSLPYTVIGK